MVDVEIGMLGGVDVDVVVGTAVVPGTNAAKASKFGELASSPLTTPGVAEVMMLRATSAGVADGFASRINAAIPATCGEAKDVPFNERRSLDPVNHEEVIQAPGAKTSTHFPKLELLSRESFESVAPTVMASGAAPGE
jgi:hypothetical protein